MATAHGATARETTDARDWVRAHAALSRLARERATLDAEEGRWLLCAQRSAVHVHLGVASFVQYVECLFGYKPRTTQEKLRVAEALEALPRTAAALQSGALSWCAARKLTRVAAADTEQTWLDTACGKTQRELEALVATKSPGDAPDAPDAEPPRPRVLRFEVAPDTFATFREAMRRLEQTAGGRLDDDALLLAMSRQVLGGPQDDGRSSYQISLTVCPTCSAGAQLANGDLVPVDATIVDMASCDAQHLGDPLCHATASTAPPPANQNDPNPPGKPPKQCSNHAHVGARRRPRARQNIPPALRRAVLARDRHRCQVPGCTHAHFVDVHHIHPLSEGGRNTLHNLLTLCTAHHRAVHRAERLIEPGPDRALAFRHADGTPYGHPSAPQRIDTFTKIFSALCHLGFREGDVKVVLSELRADSTLAHATAEQLLREALCRIRPRPR
jgi:5-methylcytosine-specific restriction endonuclease McrA